jgi:putative ABC transport system permease protein
MGTAPIRFGSHSRDVTVFGTNDDLLHIRTLAIGIGRFLPPDERDAPHCVIGSTIRSELFASQNPLGQMVRIGERRFRVIGVMAPRGTSIGMNMDEVVAIPVDSALRLFNRTSLFRVLCEVNTHQDVARTEQAVLELLTKRHGEEDVTVLTQDAVLSTFDQILQALTAALAGIAAVSLTVAGIGIMNVMLVSVAERRREIGLLKALGVTRRQVVGLFLVEASLISTAGGLVGLLVGIGGGQALQHFYPDFPVQPPIWAVLVAIGVSILVGVIFGVLPARNASRLDPVEALMRQRA